MRLIFWLYLYEEGRLTYRALHLTHNEFEYDSCGGEGTVLCLVCESSTVASTELYGLATPNRNPNTEFWYSFLRKWDAEFKIGDLVFHIRFVSLYQTKNLFCVR